MFLTDKQTSSSLMRDEYVLVFDCDERMCIDRRTVRSKSTTVLHAGMKVYQPPNPSPGIMNQRERQKYLDLYAANPLVVHVETASDDEGSSSRHFVGFGFSQNMPYYTPGTIIQLKRRNFRSTVTGMIVGCGNRRNEFAIFISLDKPITCEEASALFDGYNMTDVDEEDLACTYLSELIFKYNCTMGDLDASFSSDCRLQEKMMEKFSMDIQRMRESFEIAMTNERIQSDTSALQSMKHDFESFQSSLLITMRFNPTGIREWIQHFENYMTCAAARRGLGYIQFILY